ncbi:MAG: RNA polymerase sigma factor [candidate division Zixibacteria bacterium]|nr:RNA polymerase sigma factor [candidate division Zixibacteria bacterium]
MDQSGSQVQAGFSDRELMERFLRGEVEGFNLLVQQYKVKLFNLLYRMLGSREEAEDILQETFLRVYREREKYDFNYSFSTWIYTIALNLCRNEYKRRRKVKFFSLDILFNHPDLDSENFGNKNRLSSILEKAMNSLPVKYKKVFVLRDVNQLSYEEIALALSIPLGTVKSRVNRARRVLKKKLSPMMEECYELSKDSPLSLSVL